MKTAFVSGKYEQKDAVREVQDALKVLGFEITYDWTQDNGSNLEESALKAVKGAGDADIYIGVFLNKLPYKGALVEFGVALSNWIPCFIIGEAIDACIFINHTNVVRVEDLDDLIRKLRNYG